MRRALIPIIIIFTVAAGTGGAGLSTAGASDKENCLMCHKYTSMARIGEDGLMRNYHVSEHLFLNSLHGDVDCRGCHDYIKKFPHDPVTESVNCASECHIKPPFAEENFSHEKIVDIFEASRHAIDPDDTDLMEKSKPDCRYCHMNPMYKRVEEKMIAYRKTLDRCVNCHREKGVTEAYQHMMHRLRTKTSRSSKEIVALCSENCHGDVELMKELDVSETGVDAVETYKASIHGKMTMLGSETSADCISCHASSLIHDIYEEDNPESSINEKNLKETCENCHSKVNEHFIKIAVHPSIEPEHNPILFIISQMVLRGILYGTIFGLMGLLFLETYSRKRDGIAMKLKHGTSWRKVKQKKKQG